MMTTIYDYHDMIIRTRKRRTWRRDYESLDVICADDDDDDDD